MNIAGLCSRLNISHQQIAIIFKWTFSNRRRKTINKNNKMDNKQTLQIKTIKKWIILSNLDGVQVFLSVSFAKCIDLQTGRYFIRCWVYRALSAQSENLIKDKTDDSFEHSCNLGLQLAILGVTVRGRKKLILVVLCSDPFLDFPPLICAKFI